MSDYKKFNVLVADEDGMVIGSLSIGVVKDWNEISLDDTQELDYDNCFDMSEIETFAKADEIAPDVEERVCKILYKHFKEKE